MHVPRTIESLLIMCNLQYRAVFVTQLHNWRIASKIRTILEILVRQSMNKFKRLVIVFEISNDDLISSKLCIYATENLHIFVDYVEIEIKQMLK